MKDYRKMLKDVGGYEYENEMLGIPASGVKPMVEEIEALRKALEFYMLEAQAIAKNFDKNDEAVVASVTVLKLDGGLRAKSLLSL